MKCPHCNRPRTLRRASLDDAVSVVCDVCGRRFKIQYTPSETVAQPKLPTSTQNDEPQTTNAQPKLPTSTQNDEPQTTNAQSQLPTSTQNDEPQTTSDETTLDETVSHVEIALDEDDDANADERSVVGAARESLRNAVVYFRQAVSPRYFQGIVAYFLGTTAVLGAFSFCFSAGEIFRIYLRFFGLSFSVAAFVMLLTVFARFDRRFDFPLNFTWRCLLIPAPLVVAVLALVPAYQKTSKTPDEAPTVEAPAPDVPATPGPKAAEPTGQAVPALQE